MSINKKLDKLIDVFFKQLLLSNKKGTLVTDAKI